MCLIKEVNVGWIAHQMRYIGLQAAVEPQLHITNRYAEITYCIISVFVIRKIIIKNHTILNNAEDHEPAQTSCLQQNSDHCPAGIYLITSWSLPLFRLKSNPRYPYYPGSFSI
jgi:hypothetical protein